MLTTLPPPARRISGAAACVSTNGARTLTANSRSQSSTDVSSSVPRELSPAELTRPSRRPIGRVGGDDHGPARVRSCSSAAHEDRVELLADRLAARRVAARQDEPGAERGAAARDRGAEALGGTGDDHDLAVEAQRGEWIGHVTPR